MEKKRIPAAALIAALWAVLTLCMWFAPREEISEAERRKLAQFPTLTGESVLSGRFMSGFETFTQDQFPMRDGFRRLKSVFSRSILRQKDNHGIYIVDGQAAKLDYPLSDSSVRGAVTKFQKLYDRYLTDSARIVFSVVPDKGYYLAEEAGAPAMDYEALFSAMEALPWAEYVDLTDSLSGGDYYATDSHWRQERLIPAAQKLASALEIPAPTEGEFTKTPVERPFYGVYYGQAALPMDGETMYLMESPVLSGCTVTNLENGKTGSIYDRTKLDSRDLYDVFLSGPVSVLEVENPAGAADRELVVFRDSYGSSMVPLLAGGYSRITLVDLRYVPTDYVGNLVDFHGQDVLMLYSTTILNSSGILK